MHIGEVVGSTPILSTIVRRSFSEGGLYLALKVPQGAFLLHKLISSFGQSVPQDCGEVVGSSPILSTFSAEATAKAEFS